MRHIAVVMCADSQSQPLRIAVAEHLWHAGDTAGLPA